MLRLLLVKSEEDSHLHTQENNESLLHGTAIIKYLVLPWALPLNGCVRAKKWGIWLPNGDRLDQSGDISKDYSPMEYFFFSFPTEKINLTICLTNSCLHANAKKLLDEREFYKFLGIIILITRLEFTSREN